MANINFIKSQIMHLEDGFGAQNQYTQIQVDLIEKELSRIYIENTDVENAVHMFIKTKSGRQSLPSVETICAEVEKQRNERISSEKYFKQEHPLQQAEKILTSKLHLIHCKCLIEKIKSQLRTPHETNTPEATAFEKICKQKIEQIDCSDITHDQLEEFTKNAPITLQTEYHIIAQTVKQNMQYDPFADD